MKREPGGDYGWNDETFYDQLDQLKARGVPLDIVRGRGVASRGIPDYRVIGWRWPDGTLTTTMADVAGYRGALLGAYLKGALLGAGWRLNVQLVPVVAPAGGSPGAAKVVFWREGEQSHETAAHDYEAQALIEVALYALWPVNQRVAA